MSRALTTLAAVCALAALATSAPSRAAAPPPIKVYLFAGQSNLGWSIVSNDFKAYDNGAAGVWITSAVNDVLYYWWRGNVPNPSSNIAWQTLQPVTQRYSLEHIFAYEAWKYWKQQDPSNRIAILKVQFYGTNLFSYWNAGGRDRTPWSTNQPPHFSEGDGHRILLGRIRSGLATLSNAYELAGFFWYQGESDIDDIAMRDYAHYASTNYIKIAERYVAAYFAALTNGNLPPGTPTPLTPVNGAELTAPPASLAVYPFADPDQPDTQSAAQWQLGTISNFNSVVWELLGSSDDFASVTLPDGLVSNDTRYFWRARHADNYGVWSPWSPASSFILVPEPSVLLLLPVMLALAWSLSRS